jgi:hypothetical protein
MVLGEIGRGGWGWIGLAQDRHQWKLLVNAVINFRVLQKTGKLSRGFTAGGLSRRAQFHTNKLRGLNPRANYTTERPPFVGEAIANLCGKRGVAWSVQLHRDVK